ncbi:SDR family oxidoreductase [Streptomyces sp. RB6PN25]|uniref:SDR family oxidoreductase n=1 Tax=Streptomyces humicola TaxID=2953240 RepID=A0ABT1Q2B6_9ACTN|nr:SDR family NAD(P)-dependent oxidoreductase [Streptomyces humicola]MCQ4084073.1 SDR family oxidoreductase [Streptomyces humicola]
MGRVGLLSGRGVLVTGSGGPVAESVVDQLLGSGARVAVTDALAQAPNPTPALGSRRLVLPCGPDNPAEQSAVVETLLERFGRLDHLVNLVPTSPEAGSLMECDPSALRDIVQRHLATPLAWIQRGYWRWMAAHGGSVVNVVTGVVGNGMQDAALAGLIQLTEWLAAELAPDVDLYMVVPGTMLDSAAYQGGVAQALSDLLADRGRLGPGPVFVLTDASIRPVNVA